MKLSQFGELALLEEIKKYFPQKSKNIVVGIGDDSAVIKPFKENILITTDMMVEGIHFDIGLITPYQLGFKLISINVSDIYAMGGIPKYVLVDIAVNKNIDTVFIKRFFDGIIDALNRYHIFLIGGDISSTQKGIVISATVLGYSDRYLRRSGARVGDRIYVTGCLGDSACGLRLLKDIKRSVPLEYISKRKRKKEVKKFYKLKLSLKGLSLEIIEPLLRKHLLPVAYNTRYIRNATSMIDISDGLLIDLSRLCRESNVGARIYKEKIPVSPELVKVSSYLGVPHMKFALSGGEDYVILFTLPSKKKVKAIYIGEIIKSGKFIIDSSGKKEPFKENGYQHFLYN